MNGVSYKWDLGLVGFDSPTVSTLLSRYHLDLRTNLNNQLKLNDSTETVIAKFHRTCPFTSSKITLELRQGHEDILDMIIMTLVWVEWRQRLRMFSMIPTIAFLL